MKLKVKITGPKVHGVGYRPYLTELAMAIPLLLAVKDNTDATLEEIKAVRKTTDATLEEIKAVRKTTDTTLEVIKAVRKNTDTNPLVLEEIKGMREEIQPGYARQMQTDVRAIKERLGMH